MNLNNTQKLLVAGVVVVAAYYLFRKKPLAVADIKSSVPAPAPQNAISGIEVADLRKKKAPTELAFSGVKAPLKEPLYIKPRNLNPNIYDRGIGDEVNFYGNIRNGATMNISSACKTADKSKRMPSELPQIN